MRATRYWECLALPQAGPAEWYCIKLPHKMEMQNAQLLPAISATQFSGVGNLIRYLRNRRTVHIGARARTIATLALTGVSLHAKEAETERGCNEVTRRTLSHQLPRLWGSDCAQHLLAQQLWPFLAAFLIFVELPTPTENSARTNLTTVTKQ